MAVGQFNFTILNSSLAPVVSGGAAFYINPPLGLGPSQLASYMMTQSPAVTGSISAGQISVTLNDQASYLFTTAGYNADYFSTVALGGAASASQYLQINIATALCLVYGTLTGVDGTPQANVTVTANLLASGPIISTNMILAKTSTTMSNAAGYWSLELTPNVLITQPLNTLYTFVFAQPSPAPQLAPFFAYGIPIPPHGPSVSTTVQVPNAAMVEFTSLQ